jgi:predicted cupin superfamily sugar epimerase
VYKVGPYYFLLTKNKSGELHRITRETYRKTYARYLDLCLKKSGKNKAASQYGPREWQACPDAILSPYLAAIN